MACVLPDTRAIDGCLKATMQISSPHRPSSPATLLLLRVALSLKGARVPSSVESSGGPCVVLQLLAWNCEVSQAVETGYAQPLASAWSIG